MVDTPAPAASPLDHLRIEPDLDRRSLPHIRAAGKRLEELWAKGTDHCPSLIGAAAARLARTVDEAIRHAVEPTGAVHISIDIDCLSAGFAPGTSVPNAAGLMLWDVADAVFEIARSADHASLDIIEVSPPLDAGGITAQSAAHLVMNFLAGRAARLRQG